MSNKLIYDCAVVGGGLAGLSAAILLAEKNYSVILFEKEIYPFHKVCGEYISLESQPFLEGLGIRVNDLNLPLIKKLVVSAPNGILLEQALTPGGFGISRFTLDEMLCKIAIKKGVTVMENCKVNDVLFSDDRFGISTTQGSYAAKACCGSFGKRSNLDVKWSRPFSQQASRKLNQFVGIKYHIKTDFPPDTIALHNFKNGYCGISKIEDDRYCLCYLTHAGNLTKSDQQITLMEKNILSINPHLKKIIENAEFLYPEPLTISQVSFLKKSQVENHVLMLGDAAGLITPLCGNGMSMAMHSAKIGALVTDDFLSGKTARLTMEKKYAAAWKKQFARRLWFGRMIQYFFGKPATTNLFIAIMKKFPSLTRWLIKQTHGDPF
jgi:flavin-dependent dehydrogenase